MQPQLTSSTTFQSTHPRGVRLGQHPVRRKDREFQSTHPRGVRHVEINQYPKKSRFQSTHPRGVRLSRTSSLVARTMRFNPRTRVGCDIFFLDQPLAGQRVSIHAPAWGATATHVLSNVTEERVSIHAPAWGATEKGRISRSILARFNPRTRVGCDTSSLGTQSSQRMFQSTHPRGVRPTKSRIIATSTLAFQSTHPRGVRLLGMLALVQASLFQSTHPRGVRPDEQGEFSSYRTVSIHAPAWGATSAAYGYPTIPALFQSTHPRGVRRSSTWLSLWLRRCFNPRTRVGCDALCAASVLLAEAVSIHAPAWGATVSMFYPVDSRD